jgi:hypothetical protein
MRKHTIPVLTLVFLSPIIGELLSGSAPPAEFFTPFGLLILTALYGSGAILVREWTRRWNKGWASIFLLGMAYGIYEEGLVVRSFFDPAWQDLGLLAEYGRWIGVNWIWSVNLTIYHAVFSISIPILLVELIFPDHKDDIWLGKRGLTVFSILILLVLPMGILIGMQASWLAFLACILIIVILIRFAANWPEPNKDKHSQDAPARVTGFFFLGFIGTLVFFLNMYLSPEIGVPAIITLAVSIALPGVVMGIGGMMSRKGFTIRHQWGLGSGALLVMILLAFIAETDNVNRVDDTSGMALVGLLFVVFLIVLRVMVWKRQKTESKEAGF